MSQPKQFTKDGVELAWGDTVWYQPPHSMYGPEAARFVGWLPHNYKRAVLSLATDIFLVDRDNLYSSRAAAEAAQKAGSK